MSSKNLRWVGFLALAIVVGVLIVVIGFRPLSTVQRPLPKPNGYDDFVQAGQKRVGDAAKFLELDPASLAGMIATNREALAMVRLGLSRECRVSLEPSEEYLGRHNADLAGIKGLGSLLAAAGRLAELTNSLAEAAHCYVEVIRLGQEGSRGGVMIDKLVGVALEAKGISLLSVLKDRLSVEQGRAVIGALEAIDAKAEPAEQVLQQEHRWSRKTFGWRAIVARTFTPKVYKPAEQKFVQKVYQADQQRRYLLLDLAVRVFEKEKGKTPKALSDLVPAFLQTIPRDPITGTNMVYPL